MVKKKSNINEDSVDRSQHGASHLKSDKSEGFQEVSFNVLENAVERRDSFFGYKSRDFRGRAIISSDEMLPSKKGERSIGRLSIIVLCIILFLTVVAGVLMFLNNSGVFRKASNNTPLKEAIYEIEEFDYPIMKLNAFLQTSINSAKLRQANIEKDEYADVKKGLSEINDKIDVIAKDLNPQSEDFTMASCAKDTIEARTIMIDTGLQIYDKLNASVVVINETENLWAKVLKADASLKESDTLIQSNSTDNYQLAKQNSDTAVKLLSEASTQIKALDAQNLGFDFSIYTKYINARYESAVISSQACQALLDQNLDAIGSLNLAYIQKSNEASDIAMNMSTTPAQLLRADYDLKTKPLIDQFKAARKNAADNDFALRNFLMAD